MKEALLAIFLSASLFFVGVDFVSACSCIQPGSPNEELQKSDAVFVGTVVDIKTPSLQKVKRQVGLQSSADPIEVTFDVSKVWKGPQENKLSVNTARSSASCGYNFEKGKKYLVYSNKKDGNLNVSLCSRTNLASQAQEDINNLGESKQPEAENGGSKQPEADSGENKQSEAESKKEQMQSVSNTDIVIIAVFVILLIVLLFYLLR